jgi:hypothetical protein
MENHLEMLIRIDERTKSTDLKVDEITAKLKKEYVTHEYCRGEHAKGAGFNALFSAAGLVSLIAIAVSVIAATTK